MVSNAMNALYIFLYIAPFALINYYAFRDKLRIPVKALCSIYAVVICVQAGLFCLLSSQAFWTVPLMQAFRLGFAAFYALFFLTMIKERLAKKFYIWSLTFVFDGFVMANAYFVEARFFKALAKSIPFLVTNAMIILQLLLMLPVALRLMDKKLIPAIRLTDSKIWYTLGLVPISLYTEALITTWNIDFDKVSTLSFIIIRHCAFWSMLLVSIIIVEALRQTAENARLTENSIITGCLLELEREHYRKLAGHIEDAKKTRHDLRHHLSVVQAYISSGNKENLEKYLEQYKTSLPAESVISLCSNYAVNVLASYYIEQAQHNGIEADVQLRLPESIEIADADLCIVFGNLMENALEACKRQIGPGRFIKVRAAFSGDNVIITIDNSFEGDIFKENDIFLSSKRNGHGIGLTSVQAVAQKYDGISNFEYSGNVFRASVMLQAVKKPTDSVSN